MRLFLACCFLCLSAFGAQAQERRVEFFLAKANATVNETQTRDWTSAEHRERMGALGINAATVYYKLTSEANVRNPYQWIADNYLDNNHPTLVTLLIDGGGSTVGTSEGTDVSAGVPGLLLRVIRGDFDEDLQAFIDAVVDDGRPVVIRPFHEANGGWYPWSMYATGNSPEQLVLATQHVVRMFERSGADNVSFEMNLNRRGGDGVLEAWYRYIPFLNELVDAYSISTYNRCGTAPQYDVERSFSEEFAPVYQRLSELTELPINIAEVSTSGECAPRLPWFEEMLADIDTRFPRVEAITFFFGEVPVGKASNDVPIQWGFEPGSEESVQFRDLLQRYQARWQEAVVIESVAPSQRPQVRPVRVAQVPVNHDTAPRPMEAVQIAPSPTVQSLDAHFRMPWSVWGRMSFPLYEEGNSALNTVTGNQFGEAGPVLRFTATQRFLWNEGSFEHGPGLVLSGALSGNDDQWWNNQVSGGLTYGLYGDFPRNTLQWGGWSAEIFAGHREYFAPTPSRLDGGEGIIELRFGVNFGGDWAN